MCVTEAMILGVPPVVTRYLSSSEQITEGVSGLICDNSDDCIEHTIERCINDPELLESIRRNLNKSKFGNKEYYKIIEKELF